MAQPPLEFLIEAPRTAIMDQPQFPTAVLRRQPLNNYWQKTFEGYLTAEMFLLRRATVEQPHILRNFAQATRAAETLVGDTIAIGTLNRQTRAYEFQWNNVQFQRVGQFSYVCEVTSRGSDQVLALGFSLPILVTKT